MAPSSSKEFETISRHFFNFLLVRHPLCRLLSAYQDRVRGCKMKAEWYARGKYINNQTKENKYSLYMQLRKPYASKRVCNVLHIQALEKYNSSLVKNSVLRRNKFLFQHLSKYQTCSLSQKPLIIFCRDFLLYLSVIKATEYNNHFSPYFLHCTPCIANFSAVIKIDSPQYKAEENYLLQKTGLLALVQPEKRNQGKRTAQKNATKI